LPARDLWLTQADITLLLDVARTQWGARAPVTTFLEIAAATAARRGSVEKLRWCQVDLTRQIIDFRVAGEIVTGKRRVPVPMSDRLYRFLEWRSQEESSGAGNPDSYVIGRGQDLYRESMRCFALAANRAREAGDEVSAGRLSRASPHTLRHSWATLAAQNGVPLGEIAGVLGDTQATVDKRYRHHCPDYLRGAVGAVKFG
jgi:integrase